MSDPFPNCLKIKELLFLGGTSTENKHGHGITIEERFGH
jgi:hypothetical protein